MWYDYSWLVQNPPRPIFLMSVKVCNESEKGKPFEWSGRARSINPVLGPSFSSSMSWLVDQVKRSVWYVWWLFIGFFNINLPRPSSFSWASRFAMKVREWKPFGGLVEPGQYPQCRDLHLSHQCQGWRRSWSISISKSKWYHVWDDHSSVSYSSWVSRFAMKVKERKPFE